MWGAGARDKAALSTKGWLSWVAQFRGTYRYRYARTKKLAQQKVVELRTEVEAVKPKNITVGKHLDQYIEAAQHNLKTAHGEAVSRDYREAPKTSVRQRQASRTRRADDRS